MRYYQTRKDEVLTMTDTTTALAAVVSFLEPCYSGTRSEGLREVEDVETGTVAVVSAATGSVLHSAPRDKAALLRSAYFGGAPVSSPEPWSYADEEHNAAQIAKLRR